MSASLETVTVDLGLRSYPIYIGEGLLGNPQIIGAHIKGKQAVVITDVNVAPLYLSQLRSVFKKSLEVVEIVLPAGEESKSIDSFSLVIDQALQAGINRNSTFLSLGGGIVGDISGFAAACYQRGVKFIQIPTTLLAQVDSSVGGKTGVNHDLGKNMIGAFHQPEAVFTDLGVLNTLSEREFVAGLAEIIKYGLIADREFYLWLIENIESVLGRELSALTWAVRRSCEIKAAIVSKDEREAGLRAILNLGHTFGHAIEKCLGYGSWLHGEAVAVGMILASMLSCERGWIAQSQVNILKDLILRVGLPSKFPAEIPIEKLLEVISLDKKATDDGLRFILLKNIGEAAVVSDVTSKELRSLF